MPLPSSGQISFNDVRVEMSQSSFTNYRFSRWASGYNNGGSSDIYTPVNYLSSGSRWSLSGNTVTMSQNNLSMSAWYNYNRTLAISSSVTGTFQTHYSYSSSIPSTMLIVDGGTLSTTLSINISGSNDPYGASGMYVYYGKPWDISGTSTGSSATTFFITGPLFDPINMTFNYNYTYDSNKGQFIYFVIRPDVT